MAKKIFYGAIAITLLLNFISDFSVYQISLEAKKTGDLVNHSYRVLQAMDAVKLDIFEAQLTKKSKSDRQEIFQNIRAC